TETVSALKTFFFRHPDIFQSDVAVLHDLERDLVLDLLHGKTRRSLVLDNESFDLIVGDVARPDDRDVAPRRVADPALLAIKDPGIAVAFCGCEKSAGCAGTYERLGQSETADLVESRHWRKPLLLLLFRAIYIDRAH